MPLRIEHQDGHSADYVYDASGVKLQMKNNTVGMALVTKDYRANKVYENTVLKMILTEDGYVEPNSGSFNYYFFIKDHLGNNRVVADKNGTVAQITNYYPFGMSHAEVPARNDQHKQPYKFNGKELDRMFGLDTYDYSARMYSPAIGRFMTMDPLAEKYYSVSPYAYCMNSPVRYVDPDGREVVLSGMSEEERKKYEEQIASYRKNSELFNSLYSSLESSKDIYTINYGQISDPGIFSPNESGGGSITFAEGQTIALSVVGEEFFHAYQNENKGNYGGTSNMEFEARVFTTASYGEIGLPAPDYGGMENFQSNIINGNFGEGFTPLTPSKVNSNGFIQSYKNAANGYAQYNITNNIGNSHYKVGTTVAPYSLQRIVMKAYGK